MNFINCINCMLTLKSSQVASLLEINIVDESVGAF